jgi:crotonyl-CoA reductase
VQHILDAILAGDTSSEDFANLEIPDLVRAATVREDEVDMFEGLKSREKDPRKSLRVEDVALPELGPGEAFVAVMTSAINHNSVWTSIFEPLPIFGFLERYGKLSLLAKRHDLREKHIDMINRFRGLGTRSPLSSRRAAGSAGGWLSTQVEPYNSWC